MTAPIPPQSEHRPRVLIVDDNEDAASSLSELLELKGFATAVAHTGQAALREALQAPPEVVLLDIGLPGMNGYQLARALRQEAGLTSSLIIAITGYSLADNPGRPREAGIDYYFIKPVKLAALFERIAEFTSSGERHRVPLPGFTE